jgi:hypothetical protein
MSWDVVVVAGVVAVEAVVVAYRVVEAEAAGVALRR